eukprot:Skav209892  [mRNA]  locus=scaffold2642:368992:373353:- [translate_table: standard]
MAARWPVASIASASAVVLGVAYWLRQRQLKRRQPSEIAQIARDPWSMDVRGAFSQGYSDEFAQLMRECCQSLMVKFSAICGYTQSDEMTLVISAASIVRGEQQCHSHGGRVVKLCTLAAAHVTALFNFRLQALQQGCTKEIAAISFNPKTGETSSTLRSTIEEVPNVNLLRLAAEDGLFPADDVEA